LENSNIGTAKGDTGRIVGNPETTAADSLKCLINAVIGKVDFQVTGNPTTQDLSGASVDGTVFIE
jgi:hypothetical protein